MAGTDLIVTLIDWIDREALCAVQTFFLSELDNSTGKQQKRR
jgi:hypothetical protein